MVINACMHVSSLFTLTTMVACLILGSYFCEKITEAEFLVIVKKCKKCSLTFNTYRYLILRLALKCRVISGVYKFIKSGN